MDSNDRPRGNTSGDDPSGPAQTRSEQVASAPVGASSPEDPGDTFLSRRSDAVERRSLLPWLIAALAVVLVVGFMLLAGHHERESQQAIDAAKTPDSYAPKIQIAHLQISQATNFAGGKLAYIDGQVTNGGDRTVRGITVSVTFKNDV